LNKISFFLFKILFLSKILIFDQNFDFYQNLKRSISTLGSSLYLLPRLNLSYRSDLKGIKLDFMFGFLALYPLEIGLNWI